MMQRIFRGSLYTLLGFLAIFFVAVIAGVGFPEGSLIYGLGTGLAAAVICTTPFVLLTSVITGIGTMIQRNTNLQMDEKLKNDFLADFDENPARIQQIMQQLSPSDRAYLQQVLSARRLGVSGDGELMSLDELLDDQAEDENYNSLFTG